MTLKYAVNNSLSAITTLPSSISGGALNLISTQTASASATISFTSGIDSTYDSYIFKFYNMHPANNNAFFQFNGSTDGGSNYNVVKTTSFFLAGHKEDDSATVLAYSTTYDAAQSTAFINITEAMSNANDNGVSGTLQIFNPSSTTFVKHFICTNNHNGSGYSLNNFIAGYGNTTSAVNAIQFKMASGNINGGTIKMYGVS